MQNPQYDAVRYLPGGCHEHADGEVVTNSECHQPQLDSLGDLAVTR
jgi:hypothetical protein